MIASRRQLGFENLEERKLLAAQPTVTLDAPDGVMLGESFQLAIAFDNADATDAGFGPFVDLLVPVNGVDGIGGVGADGISFDSASYLGMPVVTTILTFPNDGGGSGSVDHPYAVDATGAPLEITGNAGDQLVVLQLPFGSFTAAQPAAVITVDMNLSDQADLGQLLNLRARGGFQFGNDPLNNPADDPSLVSDVGTSATAWTIAEPIEPTLVTLSKIYSGPEDETATGPNFLRQYTLEVDIADGQTLTDLDVIDLLPNNIVVVGIEAITPDGTTTTFPATPANSPDNLLVVNLPSVTGSTAAVDASVTFTFYVPFRDADGSPVIDPISGDDAISENNTALLGDWEPIDGRDAGGTDNVAIDVVGPEHVLTPKSIATQKSVALLTDLGGNGVSPADVLEYTIEIQISDYFGFENLVLTDVISDGQRFDPSFTPTWRFVEHGVTTGPLPVDLANFTVVDRFTGGTAPVAPLDGTQVIEVRLSDELLTRTGNGVVLGGLVPLGGTGGEDPNSASFNGGATTGTLVFRTIVQEEFSDTFPSGDASVDEGDELTNSVSVTGDVLSFADATATGQVEADTSFASISVPAGALVKSIYAINGSTALPSPLILSPGDELTYRLQLSLPTSDFEQLAIEDFLPLPILLAGEMTSFVDVVDASVPAAGQAKFGPNDSFRAVYGTTPALSVDPVSNQITFNFGDFDVVGGAAQEIDILFTVTATDAPFADGLLLTNQARRVQDTTNAGDFASDAIVQIVLGQPSLQITKGIVATSNPTASFTAARGPVTFSPPGAPGYRGSGTIHSDGLAATPINANVEEVDAGDLVTFAVVLENVGSSRAGAFDIELRDTLPPGFAIPAGGLNLSVTDGSGVPIAYTDLGAGLFDATGGIALSDPGPTTALPDLTDAGALDRYHATSGRNIMVLTYDLEVESTVVPNQSIINTATLTNYAGAEGGPDFTPVDLTDTARTLISPLEVTKTLIATNHANTSGLDVAIGEILTYRATISVPEGAAGSVTWTDIPDNGLSVIDILSVTPSSGALTLGTGTFADVVANANIGTNGDSISLTFPDLDNSNRDNTTTETIVIEYRVVVLNRAANDRGDQLNNLATVTWAFGADATAAPNVVIVEPTLALSKSIVPAGGQGTDQFLVTLDIAHAATSDSDAFEVNWTDTLPAGLIYVSGLTHSDGKAPSTLNENSGTITATFNELLIGETSQLQFLVELEPDVVAGDVITNRTDADWSSLPGSVSGPQSSDPFSNERTGIVGDPTGTNDYVATATGTVTVVSPVINKNQIATNQFHTVGNDVAIGEIVTYRATITVPQATLVDASFVDIPTAGLAILDVLSVGSSSSITASAGDDTALAAAAVIPADGSSLSLEFGTLTNTDTDSAVDETIVIEYRAVVLNSLVNDRGDNLDNAAAFDWGTNRQVIGSAPALNVVEPELVVDVSTATPATADAGDTVQFVVTVSHAGNSDADAFDVSLQNLINSVANHLVYDPNSLSITGTGGALLLSQAETGGDLSAVWTEFPLGATATLTFDVVVENSAPPQTNLVNAANIEWTSLPTMVDTPQSSNPISVERTGDVTDAGAGANDHRSSDSGFVATMIPVASKTVVDSSLTESGNGEHNPALTDLLISELVTFSILATLPESTSNLIITDQLPTGAAGVIELVSVNVQRVGNSLTAGPPTITRTDTDLDGLEDRVVLDFGSVLNTADGISNADDQIEVFVVGRVVDAASNANGNVLTNTATIDYGTGQSISTVDVEIIEPVLEIDKTGNPGTAPAGSAVDYTLVVTHGSDSASDAYAAVVTDTLADANLTLVPGTVTSTAGTVTVGNGPTDTTVVVDVGDLARGENVTISFTALVNPDLPAGVLVTNSSDLAWNSLPAGAGRPGVDTDEAAFTTAAPEIDLSITKTDSADPVTVDDPFSYTLTVVNLGPSTATDVTIVDNLPPTIVVDPTDITPSQGSSTLIGNTLTVDLGTLRPGESANVLIEATAPSTEQTVTNQATVSANETDSDTSNNTASEPTEIVQTASISGINWVDIDGNGVVDTGEIALPGTTLTISGTDYLGNPVSVDTVSGLNGEYLFDGLRPGNYVITQQQPSLFVDSHDYAGSVGGTIAGPNAIAVTLNAGDIATDYNFSEAGLRPSGFSKRMLLLSTLQAAVNPEQAALDAAFAGLAARGLGDLDGDLDTDADDRALLAFRLGNAF
jgi:fimbrial isopeptide formation D2 family protein/uncharacterized repeat protein (TIGR01451 family)